MTIPSYRAIENLIASYAELVDQGDFAGVGPAAEYEYATTVTGSEDRGDRQFRVTARLADNFPGGIADLNFDFTVENDRIRALKIAP